ncbi:MAG: hypothetical protein ACYTG7_22760, partial [Planctomycetota bacterium]
NPLLMNTTVSLNRSPQGFGGGIGCWLADPVITNTIIQGNIASTGADIYIHSGSPAVTFSNVGGFSGGADNIDADPLFMDPAQGDFHLKGTSPCINRGTIDGAPPLDIDGDPRPYMGLAEMGADEFTGLHPMEIEEFFLSAGQGGEIDFFINAGVEHAGQPYVLLGSLSGTAPGYSLPGGKTLPLNWDGFTDLVLMYLNNTYFLDFLGKLDSSGQAVPLLWVPGLFPIWIGETMYFGATLYSPFNFVTNPVAIEVVP